MKPKSLKSKIILATGISILVVGIFSYTVLYNYLAGISLQRTALAEQTRLAYIQSSIDGGLEQMIELGVEIANNPSVARALLNEDTATPAGASALIAAQEVVANSLTSNSVKPYIRKLLVFNTNGATVQAVTAHLNSWKDAENVQALPLFKTFASEGGYSAVGISPSITADGAECLAFIAPVQYYGVARTQNSPDAWLYMELEPSFFGHIISPYTSEDSGGIFVTANGLSNMVYQSGALPQALFDTPAVLQTDGGELTTRGRVYRLYNAPLGWAGLTVYSCADITVFANDGQQLFVTLAVVVFTCIAAVAILSTMLFLFVTRPLQKLAARLKRVADNDFAYDPEIEKGSDEFAQVGRVVNEMTMSIDNLIATTEDMYTQRMESEIALLQSQVNPHFLYNTLDSIYWMAVIQQSPGIAKTVRSLSNLLRNLAKGVGDKIPLGKELELLTDYVDTQKIRFMEMFELQNDIPPRLHRYGIIKFTLQPLVENAIFHGIEPLGRCGTIRLSAREDAKSLYICVEDDGVGMTRQEVEALMHATQNPHPTGMASIGVANVNNRIKLVYGRQYGLTYTSQKGVFTRATLCIPKEELPDV